MAHFSLTAGDRCAVEFEVRLGSLDGAKGGVARFDANVPEADFNTVLNYFKLTGEEQWDAYALLTSSLYFICVYSFFP